MRFDPSFLDEIRARLPVSQVVGRRVKLKRQGREYIGLSPFKQEKTPSFTVNDQKGFYHCFSTGEHGDIFTFVQKTEGLSFPETVERLAQEAGVPMPQVSARDEQRQRVADRLRGAVEAAAAFFEAELKGKRGGNARRYLDERGVSPEMVAAFRLGFAPNERHALKEHLAGKGFTQEEMAQAGLLITGEDIPVSFDRFRNRIIFPILDLRGRPIAFGGRALDPSQPAKYLNSPETPLFHKGFVLFNAARARAEAHSKSGVILVEGYMDVIALSQAGFGNVVAPLGTALGEDQLMLLWRMAPEPVLCFDGDEAGLGAAYRALDLALPHLAPGHSLRFAFLPTGQDPDDLVRREGAGAFRAVLEQARPLADVLWGREVEAGPWDTPERRAALEQRLEALQGEIAHPKVRQHYQRELAARLARLWDEARASARRGPSAVGRGAGEAVDWRSAARLEFREARGFGRSGWREGARAPVQAARPGPSESLKRSGLARSSEVHISPREAALMLALLNHPWLLDAHVEQVALIPLRSRALEQLRDGFLHVHAELSPLDSEGLRTQLSKAGLGGIVARVESAITHKSDRFIRPEATRQDVEAGWRQSLVLHRKSLELERELEAAERAFQAEETDEAFDRICDIRRQLLDTEGTEASVEDGGPASKWAVGSM